MTKSLDLSGVADGIPSMGGHKVGPILRDLAREAPAGTSIVEVGTWLGAGTAQLALGMRERQSRGDVALHCYDRWQATRNQTIKAARFGVRLAVGEDTLPRVRRTMEPFGVSVEYHKGELLESRWSGEPISVYVDDASKMPETFMHSLSTFGSSWMPGTTLVVLMDYEHWKTSGDPRHQCQKKFIESNGSCFERLVRFDDARHPVFLYKESFDRVPIDLALMALHQAQQRLQACHDSASWRITAPLRTVSNAVRRGSWRTGLRPPAEAEEQAD